MLTIRERYALRLVHPAPDDNRRPIPRRLAIVLFGTMVAAIAVAVIGIARVFVS